MRLSITYKFVLFILILISITVGIGLYNIRVIRTLNETSQVVYQDNAVFINAVSELKHSVLIIQIALDDYTHEQIASEKSEKTIKLLKLQQSNIANAVKVVKLHKSASSEADVMKLLDAYENLQVLLIKFIEINERKRFDQQLLYDLISSKQIYLSKADALLSSLISKRDAFEKRLIQDIDDTFNNLILELVFISLVAVALGLSLINNLLSPLKDLTFALKKLSQGSSVTEIPHQSRADELGEISQSIAKLNHNFKEIIQFADTASKGKLDVALEVKSEFDKLAIALNQMISNQRSSKEENINSAWLQEGQVNFSNAIQTGKNYENLADNILQTLCPYVDAQIGTIYHWEELDDSDQGYLKLSGAYAFNLSDAENITFSLGESLIGQAALENKIMLVDQVDEDYIRVVSSLGDSKPRNLLLVPFDFHGELRGVMELGFVQNVDKLTFTLLSSLRVGLAAAFENIAAQTRQQALIKRTQTLVDEISVAEKRTSGILNSSLSSIITISPFGIIESCNNSTVDMFGYSAGEMIGHNVKMLMPGPIASEHDGYLDNYKQTGMAKIIGSGREVVALRKDESTFNAHLSVVELKIGEKLSYIGTLTDITEQVKSREDTRALLEKISINEQRTRTIIESSLACIITITTRGIIESCNSATELLFGYDRSEMVGKNVKMLMPDSFAREHDGYLKSYQETGFAKIIGIGREVVAQRKDGTTFHIHLSVAEMKLGGQMSYLGMISDIDKQVEQREQIISSNQELQANSEEMAAQQEELRITNESLIKKGEDLENQKKILEYSQKQLEAKAKELEDASKYKSEFLANMSHELRTPLNSLLILSKSLSENENDNLSTEEVEFAEVIEESGNNLLSLINDILDLSKVEAGQMSVHFESINVLELELFLNNRFIHMARDKGIDFMIDISPDMPTSFVSDYSKLGQILTNLISNAIKFTEQGSVTLSIMTSSVKPLVSSYDQLFEFRVSDTGIGIADDKQDSVFTAFQQVDGATNRKYGGTGLGLSIVSSFTKLLEGTVQLTSQLGKGSEFSLFLPELLLTEVSKFPKSSETVLPVIEDVNLKNTKPAFEDDREHLNVDKILFLIIEDDEKFAKILLDNCHQQGAQALVAPDGETGINLASNYSVTGIILDFMLPGLDGSDVLAALKSDSKTRHIPVHVISAVDDLMDMQKLGAIGQLPKPVSKTQIKSVLEQLKIVNDLSEVNLLIVEDDDIGALAVTKLLSKEKSIKTERVTSGEQAIEAIKHQNYAALILDLNLPDMTGFELLQICSEDKEIKLPPVIVYTGKDLTDEEHMLLQSVTDSVVIKSVRSPERLLDEVRLFVDHVHSVSFDQLEQVEQHVDHYALVGKSVLLVDDDMRNTFSLAKVLRKKNIQVHIAPSGKDALQILSEHSGVDLILMDIMMPEMDGYETIRRIRKQQAFKELPIIALTANAMSGDKEKCLKAGANDYLSKPVEVEKLLLQMKIWL